MRICPSCASMYLPDKEFCGLDGERLVDRPEESQLGEMIGRYRLEQVIGRGSTGIVYSATHVDTNETHALKLLYGELASDHRTVERFRREAEASSRIHHPNVVHVLEYQIGAPSYIVMEIVRGKSLSTAIAQEGIFPHERAANITHQIALGLAEAHSAGFIHRDLKPSNVMLVEGRDAHGDPCEIAKILDFGIVRPLAKEGDGRLTQQGFVIGTPHYMAPEQIDESGLGPPTDVYALGVILYEMLSGRTPYTGARDHVLMKKLMRDADPLPPETGDLGLLAMKLLERDAHKRPQNALLVSAELHRMNLVTEDPKTVASPVPWHEPTNEPTVMTNVPRREPSDPPADTDESNPRVEANSAAATKIGPRPLRPPSIGAATLREAISTPFAAEKPRESSGGSTPPLEITPLMPGGTSDTAPVPTVPGGAELLASLDDSGGSDAVHDEAPTGRSIPTQVVEEAMRDRGTRQIDQSTLDIRPDRSTRVDALVIAKANAQNLVRDIRELVNEPADDGPTVATAIHSDSGETRLRTTLPSPARMARRAQLYWFGAVGVVAFVVSLAVAIRVLSEIPRGFTEKPFPEHGVQARAEVPKAVAVQHAATSTHAAEVEPAHEVEEPAPMPVQPKTRIKRPGKRTGRTVKRSEHSIEPAR